MTTRLLPPLLLLLSACSSDDATAECAGVAVPSIRLTLVEADTGEPVCDATVELRRGQDVQKAEVNNAQPCRYVGYGAAGQYTVTASRQGYQTATREVTVQSNECGPITAETTLSLGKL